MPKSQAPKPDPGLDLMLEIFATFFRLRAVGRQLGAVSESGGGSWGLMRSLAIGGPQTVPDLARARPVARQWIQQLADELAERGLVEFRPNPAHKRSSLVALTPAGRAEYRRLSARVARLTRRMGRAVPAGDLARAAATLRDFRAALDRL